MVIPVRWGEGVDSELFFADHACQECDDEEYVHY